MSEPILMGLIFFLPVVISLHSIQLIWLWNVFKNIFINILPVNTLPWNRRCNQVTGYLWKSLREYSL